LQGGIAWRWRTDRTAMVVAQGADRLQTFVQGAPSTSAPPWTCVLLGVL